VEIEGGGGVIITEIECGILWKLPNKEKEILDDEAWENVPVRTFANF
jgi:hypothetical protein